MHVSAWESEQCHYILHSSPVWSDLSTLLYLTLLLLAFLLNLLILTTALKIGLVIQCSPHKSKWLTTNFRPNFIYNCSKKIMGKYNNIFRS